MFRKILAFVVDAATYGASSVLGQLIGFFLLPVYTRFLTPSEYGVSAMMATLNALFLPISHLGLPNSVFRNFNLHKDEEGRARVLMTGLLGVTVSSIGTLISCLIFIDPLTEVLSGEGGDRTIVCLTLISSTLSSIGMLPFAALRAQRRVKSAAMLNLVRLLVSVAVTIALVVVEKHGLLGVVVGTLAGEAVVLAVNLAMTLRAFSGKASVSVLKDMLNYGLPFVPRRLLSQGLIYVGQFALAKMISLEQAGIYNIAVRFSAPLTLVMNSVQTAWIPYKFQINAEDDDPTAFFRTVTTYYLAGATYLWLGISLWGPEVIRVMTATQYHAASGLIAAVATIPLVQAVRLMLGTGIELGDNTRMMAFEPLIGLVIVSGAILVLSPLLGATGVALASTLGYSVMTVFIYRLSSRVRRVDYDWSSLILFGVSALILVLLSGLGQDRLPTTARVGLAFLGSLAYPLLVFLILLRSPTERARMQLVWSRLLAFREKVRVPRARQS